MNETKKNISEVIDIQEIIRTEQETQNVCTSDIKVYSDQKQITGKY
jgi:DNA-binding protein